MEEEKSVGTILREAREAKGLSIEELYEKTRILTQYIELLEQDRYDFLPEPYVRGFVRSLAEKLEIDAEPLLDQIHSFLHPEPEPEEGVEGEEGLEAPEPVAEKPKEAHKPARRPRRTGDYVLAALFVIVIGIVVWVYAHYKDRWFGPSGQSVKEIPLEAALSDTSSAPTTPRRTPWTTPSASASKLSPIALTLEATDSSWVRVVVDDTLAHEYLFGPGNSKTLQGFRTFYIKTGNAGGLALKLNGKDVGPVGAPGQVVELWINRDGEVRKRAGRVPRRTAGEQVQP